MEIGTRLKKERTRIGLSEYAVSAMTGISERQQSDYENNLVFPGADYLAFIAAIGFDIGFIVTGKKPIQNPLGINSLASNFSELNNVAELSGLPNLSDVSINNDFMLTFKKLDKSLQDIAELLFRTLSLANLYDEYLTPSLLPEQLELFAQHAHELLQITTHFKRHHAV